MLARTKGFRETPRDPLATPCATRMLPTLTLTGVQLTFLIGGTVIIERIFSYEGLGNLAIDAVINRDLPLIQGIVLLFAVLFVGINLGVDLLYARAQPEAAPWLRPSQNRRRAALLATDPAGRLAGDRVDLRRSSRRSIAPHDPLAQDLLLQRLPPAWLNGSEPGYSLGTDGLGRDVLSRIIYGSRIALTVAFVAAPRPASSARCWGCSPAISAAGSTRSCRASSTSGWRSRRCSSPSCSSPSSAPGCTR